MHVSSRIRMIVNITNPLFHFLRVIPAVHWWWKGDVMVHLNKLALSALGRNVQKVSLELQSRCSLTWVGLMARYHLQTEHHESILLRVYTRRITMGT